MKKKHILALGFICLSFSTLFSKSVEDCSIVIWPKFNWLNSEIELAAKDYFRANDYIVYESVYGLKESFRSDQYYVDKANVLLECRAVPSMMIKDRLEKLQSGIGGLWLTQMSKDLRFEVDLSARKKIHRHLHENGQTMFYFMDKQLVDQGVEPIANHCDQMVIYLERALIWGQSESVAYYLNKCRKIRAAHPGVKLFAGLELKMEENNSAEILEMLSELASEVEGFVFVLEGTEVQKSTTVDLLKAIRS